MSRESRPYPARLRAMSTNRSPQSSVNSAPMISLMPPPIFFRRVRAHHARERALVGDRERGVAQLPRLHDQLLRMRGAAQEAEVAQAVELGVRGSRRSSGAHYPKIPCRNQRRGVHSWWIQSTDPCLSLAT